MRLAAVLAFCAVTVLVCDGSSEEASIAHEVVDLDNGRAPSEQAKIQPTGTAEESITSEKPHPLVALLQEKSEEEIQEETTVGVGRRGGGAPAAAGSFSMGGSNRAGNSEDATLRDEELAEELGIHKSKLHILAPEDLGESATVEATVKDKMGLRQQLGLHTCTSACEVARHVLDDEGRKSTCRTLHLNEKNCDACSASALGGDKPDPVHMSNVHEDYEHRFAGIPREDPGLVLADHLGDSLQQHHVTDLMAKTRHMTESLDAAVQAVKDMPHDATNEDTLKVQPHLDRYFAAAKQLQPDALIESSSGSVSDHEAVKALKADPAFQSSTEASFKKIKAIANLRSLLQLREGEKLKDKVKWGIPGLSTIKKKVKDMIKGFMNKLGKMIIDPIMGFIRNSTFVKKMAECTSLDHLEKPMKCSGGELEGHAPRRCLNGGGDGSEWLWAEMVNTRKHPTTWVKKVRDATFCEGKDCKEENLDYCDQRYNDGYGQSNKETKKIWSTFNLEKAKAICECGVESPTDCGPKSKYSWDSGVSPDCKVKKKCDKRCRFVGTSGNYLGKFRCVPAVDPQNPKYRGRTYTQIHQGIRIKNRRTGKCKCVGGKYQKIKKPKGEVLAKEYTPNDHRGQTEGVCVGGKNVCKSYTAYNAGKKKTMNVEANFAEAKDAPAGLTLSQFTTQKYYAQFQNAVQPFGGKTLGFRLSMRPGATEKELQKAFKRTGDYCVNYDAPSKPDTRLRCASGQFHHGVDDGNFMLCANINAKTIGHTLMKQFKKMVGMIPGIGKKIQGFMGPAMTKIIESWAGVALDAALANIPFFGIVYKWFTHTLYTWVGINIRNVLTQSQPKDLVAERNAVMDFAIDKTQARMKRVYCPKAKKCDPELTKHLPKGYRCPEHIPLREALMTTGRAGDLGVEGALGTRWPGRSGINLGSTDLSVAYLEANMCLSLPVCDPELMAKNLHEPQNRDCKSHGQCVWNMKKGNHCICDKGFTGDLCEKSQGGGNSENLGETQEWSSRRRSGSSEKKAVAKAEAATASARNKAAAASKATKGKSVESVFDYHKKDWKWPFNGWSSKRPFPQTLGLDKKTGCDICEASCTKKLTQEQERRNAACEVKVEYCGQTFKDAFSNAPAHAEGTHDVSLVCQDTSDPRSPCGSGKRKRCVRTGPKPHQCADMTKWACSSNKHTIACDASHQIAPTRTTVETDKLCGRWLLTQKMKKKDVCSNGIRKNMACTEDADCPCGGFKSCGGSNFGEEELGSSWFGGKKKSDKNTKKAGGKTPRGPPVCCTEAKKNDKRCRTWFGGSVREGLPGCKQKVIHNCDHVGMAKFATMGLRL
jgi:hypothetical protein